MDALYSRLNSRGRKQFKGSEPVEFEQSHTKYSNIGLPAHKAALDGDVPCLRDFYLSKHDRDEGVPSRDVNGATPLHLASRTNRIEVIRWILRFTDLSPLTVAKHGETPAHVAAAQGHAECLKLMLTAEGKTDIKSNLATSVDNSGFTALHLAIVKHRNECAKLLISELGAKGVGALNESGITAAHVAASAGNIEILKVLGQKHKKLMAQEASDGTTPVYFAAQEGKLDALKFLSTKLRCDLTTPSNDGLKPIHAASQCGHTHIVKFIVSSLGNSSVFDTTPDGATPLHFAASSGQVKTAHWLINSDIGGSLIVAKDKNGDTAAHDAADSGQCEVLKVLLECGADLYAMNNEGNTAYSLALSGQDSATANFVMTFASKSPQKQDNGPSQMTIYDLQGDVDVVNIESTEAVPPKGQDEADAVVIESPKKSESSNAKSSAKKAKKEKGVKKKKSSNSFLDSSATADALKSLETDTNVEHAVAQRGNDLDMTEDDLANFSDEQTPKPKDSSSPSDEEEIVVRYSDKKQYTSSEQTRSTPGIASSDYSTVNELAESEERKKNKKVRKISKSIQNALKPRKKKVSDSGKQSDTNTKGFSGPEMGFKPQFKSNPLQRLSGVDSSFPPTPPPTPATGASIAPSEDKPQSTLNDVDEEDGNPYDMYSDFEPNSLKQEETSPEVPADTKLPSESDSRSHSKVSVASDKPSPKAIGKLWPPPDENDDDHTNDTNGTNPRSKSAQSSVLGKWKPQEWKKEVIQPPPKKMDIDGWLKNVKQKDKPSEEEEPLNEEPLPTEVSIAAPDSVEEEMNEKVVIEETSTTAFVSLKHVQRVESGSFQEASTKSELVKVKLKKTLGKQVSNFSKPETEIASGATDELLKFLKERQ